MLNSTQQQSKLAKRIFEKVDEYKDWSVKVERLKSEFELLNGRLSEETERYNELNNGFSEHKSNLDDKISLINDKIDKLCKEEDDKIQLIRGLEVKINDKQQEYDEFRDKIIISEKDLTDKIKGIELELVTAEENKEKKLKELQSVQLEARLAAISYEQLKEETERLAKTLLEMKDHIADIEKREKDIEIRELRLQRLKKEVINK